VVPIVTGFVTGFVSQCAVQARGVLLSMKQHKMAARRAGEGYPARGIIMILRYFSYPPRVAVSDLSIAAAVE
jgi:hypothetical protein